MPDIAIDEPCEALSWDTKFWGFPVARVRGHTLTPDRVASIDRWCQERAIACLYFLATFDDPLTVRCAEDGQFRLVDARVTFKIVPELVTAPAEWHDIAGITIRPVVESDIDRLQHLAGESFLQTRFHFDVHFPRLKARQLYERWFAESCRGYADQVFVAETEGAPVGFITCHLPVGEQPAQLRLIAVAPQLRNRGIGRALRQHALDWFARRDVLLVTTVTQGRNLAMQVLNQRCGFDSLSFQLWYHKWYRPPTPDAP
jgi:dTDP-4-amino-4,6-dideoxy-D-galactose acyltransferase